MYIGTLDHKLLIIDQDKEEVVGEILLLASLRHSPLRGPKDLYLITNTMNIEIGDLAARKVVELSISLNRDGRA